MNRLAAVLMGIGILTSTGLAAENCFPKEQMSEALATRFGEMAFASGISVDSSVKFYGNPRTGTWSVVVTQPDGLSCVVAIGDGLEVGMKAMKTAAGASL